MDLRNVATTTAPMIPCPRAGCRRCRARCRTAILTPTHYSTLRAGALHPRYYVVFNMPYGELAWLPWSAEGLIHISVGSSALAAEIMALSPQGTIRGPAPLRSRAAEGAETLFARPSASPRMSLTRITVGVVPSYISPGTRRVSLAA